MAHWYQEASDTMLKSLWKNPKIRTPLGILAGAAAGFLYYSQIGCPTGGCPLTSNLYVMLAFGGFLGYTFVSDAKRA